MPFGKNLLVKRNIWKYDVQWKGDTAGVNAERHLRSLKRLIRLVYDRRRQIARIIPPGECWVYTTVYSDSPNCIVQLPLEAMHLLAKMKIRWYCSVWCVSQVGDALTRSV